MKKFSLVIVISFLYILAIVGAAAQTNTNKMNITCKEITYILGGELLRVT